ncbi:MAG TPA: aminotransferase class I/II-fold pyridoxal phosphate-dependent enzyme [Methanothrix sp.]|nr:aminotransferase class I/II-fold pyridoxal phosphate-dependent enzyme [Methanothrix sp.]
MEREPGFGTRCVHAGEGHHPFGAHVTPIYQTSTYVFENTEQAAIAFSKGPAYRYIRSPPNTPTHAAFIDKICSLEGGTSGLAFASGMAAETALVLSRLKKGDHLLSTDIIYGGSFGLFSTLLTRFGIDVDFVDTTDIEKVKSALRENTKLVFLETPSNPTLAVSDIGEIARIAHVAGAWLAVDNTFSTPYFQRPLLLGADVVVESCTKYIGGHGDLLGGVATGSKETISAMRKVAVLAGGTMGTHEAWLCLRGLKTLHLRMKKHAENALMLAQYLEAHPSVARVNYPGLESHAEHSLAKRQMSGWGGMLSFEVRGGLEAARRFMNSLKLASLAVSLGSVDTLVEHPASMTHAEMPKQMREKMGIGDGLVRASVGIEDGDDILDDFAQALDSMKGH